jgi:hypothetical protein
LKEDVPMSGDRDDDECHAQLPQVPPNKVLSLALSLEEMERGKVGELARMMKRVK